MASSAPIEASTPTAPSTEAQVTTTPAPTEASKSKAQIIGSQINQGLKAGREGLLRPLWNPLKNVSNNILYGNPDAKGLPATNASDIYQEPRLSYAGPNPKVTEIYHEPRQQPDSKESYISLWAAYSNALEQVKKINPKMFQELRLNSNDSTRLLNVQRGVLPVESSTALFERMQENLFNAENIIRKPAPPKVETANDESEAETSSPDQPQTKLDTQVDPKPTVSAEPQITTVNEPAVVGANVRNPLGINESGLNRPPIVYRDGKVVEQTRPTDTIYNPNRPDLVGNTGATRPASENPVVTNRRVSLASQAQRERIARRKSALRSAGGKINVSPDVQNNIKPEQTDTQPVEEPIVETPISVEDTKALENERKDLIRQELAAAMEERVNEEYDRRFPPAEAEKPIEPVAAVVVESAPDTTIEDTKVVESPDKLTTKEGAMEQISKLKEQFKDNKEVTEIITLLENLINSKKEASAEKLTVAGVLLKILSLLGQTVLSTGSGAVSAAAPSTGQQQ